MFERLRNTKSNIKPQVSINHRKEKQKTTWFRYETGAEGEGRKKKFFPLTVPVFSIKMERKNSNTAHETETVIEIKKRIDNKQPDFEANEINGIFQLVEAIN